MDGPDEPGHDTKGLTMSLRVNIRGISKPEEPDQPSSRSAGISPLEPANWV